MGPRRIDLQRLAAASLLVGSLVLFATRRVELAFASVALTASLGATVIFLVERIRYGWQPPLARAREPRPAPSGAPIRALLLSGAALLTVLAVAVAWEGARRSEARTSVVDLWLLGGTDGSLRLGIDTDNAAAARYRLELRSGKRVLHEWQSLAVVGTVHRTFTVRLPKGWSGRVDALLYRAGASGHPLRRVTWSG